MTIVFLANYDLLLKWLNGLPDTFPYVEKRETDSLINVGITAGKMRLIGSSRTSIDFRKRPIFL